MTRDKDQAQQVIAEIVVESRFKIRHGHLFLFKLATEFFVLALQHGVSAEVVNGRCLAVAMSQAPGLSGTPDCGHCSSAATRASCARSSARPTSRTIRVRPAMSLGDSILQT